MPKGKGDKEMTERQLYSFVSRADTIEKINKAEAFLRNKFDEFRACDKVDLWDDLMECLAYQYRDIKHREKQEHMLPYAI